ncbi:MAG: hypothetical protein ACFFD4_32710, partial [Candidatus Odinarchaeota archaeon]
MPIQWLYLPYFTKKKLFYRIISSALVLVIVFLLIQGFNMNVKHGKPLTEQPGLVGFLGTVSVIAIVFVLVINSLASHYRSKYGEGPEVMFQPDKIELLQSIRNKVVIGLENIKDSSTQDFQENEFLIRTTAPVTMLDHFPPEIQHELQTEIKGKTVFTLIEVAYQDPTETNPTRLAKNLNIPLSSLSREIKKLSYLNYLEPC